MHKSGSALFALAALVASQWLAPAARAETYYPWCIQYGAYASTNCGYVSEQQCRQAIAGPTDMCMRNPQYWAADRPRPARKRVRN